MCTYNGARYIQEQLTSILFQTRSVDEIVICDDGSTDDTLSIISNIQKNSPVFIRLIQNKENIGYFKNFLQAISLCSSDMIFLSDQDDVWRKDKVEKICEWLDAHQDMDVVFTNANLIDENSMEFTTDTLWDRVGFNPRMRKYFDNGYGQEVWTINNRATGATMAFRKSFVADMDLASFDLHVHDYIIAFFSIINNCCGYINEQLTSYRIHSGQTIGASLYAPCFYPPTCAYTIELDNVQNLPEYAMNRLLFMRQREKRYDRKLGGFYTLGYIGRYITIYGKWWYRFLGYDIYHCLMNEMKRIYRKCKYL